RRGERAPPRRLDLSELEARDHALGRGERGLVAGRAAGVRERAIEARVGEAREAVAHLLPRAAELVRREAGGGLPAGAIEGLAQPPLVVARGDRGDDRDRPIAPVTT